MKTWSYAHLTRIYMCCTYFSKTIHLNSYTYTHCLLSHTHALFGIQEKTVSIPIQHFYTFLLKNIHHSNTYRSYVRTNCTANSLPKHDLIYTHTHHSWIIAHTYNLQYCSLYQNNMKIPMYQNSIAKKRVFI